MKEKDVMVGARLPHFTILSTDGHVSDKELMGKWSVIFFYPKDKTPG